VDRVLSTLAALISELCSELHQVCLDQAPPQITTDPDADPDQICRELRRLLYEDNLAATQILAEHRALLKAAYPRHFDRLERAIAQFNYTTALDLLDQAALTPDTKTDL
jgi:hypothetical protein